MGIDKGGKDRHSRLAARSSRFGCADSDDATVVDLDPSIANWRRVDGQNPGGAVDVGHAGQCPVNRAFFSDALRAG